MFTSIAQMDFVFCRYDDGTMASRRECDRCLLTKLVCTAASNNYWLSRYALDILQCGVDSIQVETDAQDLPYLELITKYDWALLWEGTYSNRFVRQHSEYVIGRVADLLAATDDSEKKGSGSSFQLRRRLQVEHLGERALRDGVRQRSAHAVAHLPGGAGPKPLALGVGDHVLNFLLGGDQRSEHN